MERCDGEHWICFCFSIFRHFTLMPSESCMKPFKKLLNVEIYKTESYFHARWKKIHRLVPDLCDLLEQGFRCCRTTTNNDREPLMQQMFIFNMKIFWQLRRYLVTRYFCSPSIYFPHLHMHFSKYLLNHIRDFPEQHSFYLCSLLSRSVGDQPGLCLPPCLQWATVAALLHLQISFAFFSNVLSSSLWPSYHCDPTERGTLQATSFSFPFTSMNFLSALQLSVNGQVSPAPAALDFFQL